MEGAYIRAQLVGTGIFNSEGESQITLLEAALFQEHKVNLQVIWILGNTMHCIITEELV